MKYYLWILLSVATISGVQAQELFDLDKVNNKSNDFTKHVMSEGSPLHDKLPVDVVPMDIEDFNLTGSDSLAVIRIRSKFVEYYDFLLDYQKQQGITTENLSKLFLDSANDNSSNLSCFEDWYKRETHTVVLTLACYQGDIASVKDACIARSIHATIINNSAVAECLKEINLKQK